MTNKPSGVLFIGLMDHIEERVKEHKLKIYPKSFTAKYICDKLVYFETFEEGIKADQREGSLKNGKEIGKLNLLKR
jgi:putative endonuclease